MQVVAVFFTTKAPPWTMVHNATFRGLRQEAFRVARRRFSCLIREPGRKAEDGGPPLAKATLSRQLAIRRLQIAQAIGSTISFRGKKNKKRNGCGERSRLVGYGECDYFWFTLKNAPPSLAGVMIVISSSADTLPT